MLQDFKHDQEIPPGYCCSYFSCTAWQQEILCGSMIRRYSSNQSMKKTIFSAKAVKTMLTNRSEQQKVRVIGEAVESKTSYMHIQVDQNVIV